MVKLRVLDLFSGIGGFSLGLERTGGFETVAFCEIEEFPRKVLAKHWPDVPQFHDVRKLRGEDVGSVDIICGGYPCQPFSTAGKRQGAEDDRHLWPEFNRLVAELRPTWVIGENVAGHISMGLDDVLSDLEGQGYACRTFVIPACAVDAPHRRDRVWTVAHATSERHDRTHQPDICRAPRGKGVADNAGDASGARRIVADTPSLRRGESEDEKSCGKQGKPAQARRGKQSRGTCIPLADATGVYAQGYGNGPGEKQFGRSCRWLPEPNVGRVAHGVPDRVDRLKALGNAVVPAVVTMIGRAILEAEAT